MEDTTIEDMLKTAEAQYIQQDYAGALKTLTENQTKISSGIWHYNVGTVYGAMKDYPLARYHLMQADRDGFSTKESRQNLELVENQLEISRLEKPLSPGDYMVKGSLVAAEGILTAIGLLILVVGLLGLRKQQSFKAFGALIGVVVLIFGLNWWIKSWPLSIVIKNIEIYEGPSTIFNSRDELPAGVMVLTTEKNGWKKIIYPSRFNGWIKVDDLKELK